ncbi:MAG: hypothetical protein K9M01_02975, partial [Candidatus Omnitrophica bacterium]|nr:hypothetical protein [Candidatus Omnitrophota bacterium]
QTLDLLTKSLLEREGIERNLAAKKFMKSIIYSIESIQINLFFPVAKNKKAVLKKDGNLVCKERHGSRFRCIPIILPNEVHGSRKRNVI